MIQSSPAELAAENERLRAELAQARQRLSQLEEIGQAWDLLVQYGAEIMLRIDRDAKIKYLNRVDPRHPVETVMGASAYDFVSPEHQSVMRREIERVAATGEPGYYEVQVETDGRWYATRVVPAPAPSDELVLICNDITERRRAEQELRQSQEWFATVFRVCPAATVITRLSDGQLVDANEAFCQLTGMNREQLVGERIDQLSMWADFEERSAFIDDVRREGVVHGRQCQFLDRQGEPRIGLVSGGCLEVDGQPYLICSARDITELKQTEQMLRENESRLRLMLSQLPAVVWTVDCQLRFT